jgi:signal transduction histidine kinase
VRATVNANEMKQVILNLIKNGFEAMPDGGTITVTTEEAVVESVATALVHVEDDGPGISTANLPGRGCRLAIALPLVPRGAAATENETAPPGRG